MMRFWKPSLEWGRNYLYFRRKQTKVYYDDFAIKNVNLIYYRYPIAINMADGYLDTNGQPTVDVDPEFLGSSVIEIPI